MKIVLSPKAEKQLRKLAKINQIAVAHKIRQLTDDSNKVRSKKLAGFSNIFRIRVGDFRIVYELTNKKIYIILISHRREVYKLAQRLLG